MIVNVSVSLITCVRDCEMSTLIQESQQQSDISTMTEILINTNTAMINVVWEGFNSNTRIALMYIDSFSNRQLLLKTSSACRPPCLQKPNQVFDIPITMSTIYKREDIMKSWKNAVSAHFDGSCYTCCTTPLRSDLPWQAE